MPHYYFDIRDGDTLITDHGGTLLSGIKAAQRQAQHALGEMLRRVSGSAVHRVLTIEVRDEAKRPLFRVKLSFDIEPLPGVALTPSDRAPP
jgi:hypothetical protein